jgi:hypothetical protein
MRQAILISGIAAILLLMSSSSSLAAPEIYRWVDDEGVVHFSEQPPANGDAEKVDTRVDESSGIDFDTESLDADTTTDPGAPNMAEQLRQERAEFRREESVKRAEIEAKCEQANAAIAQLEPFPRVMTVNAEGETVRMNDDVRLEKLGAAKDFVAANCNK